MWLNKSPGMRMMDIYIVRYVRIVSLVGLAVRVQHRDMLVRGDSR